MKRVLQLFRVASVEPVENTTSLDTTVSGGVLWSTLQKAPGSGVFTTVAPIVSETATLSHMAFLFVVLVIFELFDNFSI
jgi:hypothetical protein